MRDEAGKTSLASQSSLSPNGPNIAAQPGHNNEAGLWTKIYHQSQAMERALYRESEEPRPSPSSDTEEASKYKQGSQFLLALVFFLRGIKG